MTNFEKIKAMNIEEMAEELSFYIDCGLCPIGKDCTNKYPDLMCKDKIKILLKSEVEENEDN